MRTYLNNNRRSEFCNFFSTLLSGCLLMNAHRSDLSPTVLSLSLLSSLCVDVSDDPVVSDVSEDPVLFCVQMFIQS